MWSVLVSHSLCLLLMLKIAQLHIKSIDNAVLVTYNLIILYTGGEHMSFSYKPLWKLLIDREMSKKHFMELTGISKSTVMKMNRGENVSMEVLDRICTSLHCNISDIVFFVED